MGKGTSRPSVPHAWMLISLMRRIPEVPPDGIHRASGLAARSSVCLAPHGVSRAPLIALGAVGSYPAFSPLPSGCPEGGMFSVILSVAPALHRSAPFFKGRAAMWCPDFPPPARGRERASADRSEQSMAPPVCFCKSGMGISTSNRTTWSAKKMAGILLCANLEELRREREICCLKIHGSPRFKRVRTRAFRTPL